MRSAGDHRSMYSSIVAIGGVTLRTASPLRESRAHRSTFAADLHGMKFRCGERRVLG